MNIRMGRNLRRNAGARGFSLLEVLIAVLIFSIGLVGMAGLMLVSVRTNQSAYLRTQASFLAHSFMDRLRANRAQINAYNGDYSAATAGTDPCTGGVVCNQASQLTRDKAIWSRMLADTLPNPTANLTCDGVVLGAVAQAGAAPYRGLCTLRITWDEASIEQNTSGTPNLQTFSWVFQP